jgi:hypothetical protein
MAVTDTPAVSLEHLLDTRVAAPVVVSITAALAAKQVLSKWDMAVVVLKTAQKTVRLIKAVAVVV